MFHPTLSEACSKMPNDLLEKRRPRGKLSREFAETIYTLRSPDDSDDGIIVLERFVLIAPLLQSRIEMLRTPIV